MPDAKSDLPSIEERRLDTPSRATLLKQYEETERFCRGILGVEAAVTFGALVWIVIGVSRASWSEPWPWVAAGLGGFGVFRWFPAFYFLSKKRLEDLRPDVSFGVHNRDTLLALAQRVFSRLQLPSNAAPVFVTRAKDVNALAVRCELLPGVHAFNGVFLNRAILHLLDEPELESVVGHELGHVYPYSPLLSRTYLLHSIAAATVSFAIASMFRQPTVAFFAPFFVLFILDRVIAYPHLRISRGIEFLCDDFGARAAGLMPALSAEFKIGAESEARQQITLHMLQAAAKGGEVSLKQLAEDYEAAVPFGRADPATVRAEMEKLSAARRRADKGISVGGFLDYLGDRGGDDEEQQAVADHESKRLAELMTLPLVPVDRALYLKGAHAWTPALAARLVAAVEGNPQAVLFHLESEVSDREVSHPSTSRRMLFLWRNRDE